MARCIECSKFVAVEMPQPEAEADYTNGMAGVQVRISLVCAECGSVLFESTIESEVDVADFTNEHAGEEHSIEVSIDEVSAAEGTHEGRRVYGAFVKLTIACECGADMKVDWSDDVLLSDMEQL